MYKLYYLLIFTIISISMCSCTSFQKWRMRGYKEELERQEEKTPEGKKRKKDKMLFPDRGGKKSTLNESPYNSQEAAIMEQMREQNKKETYERSKKVFGIFTPKE